MVLGLSNQGNQLKTMQDAVIQVSSRVIRTPLYVLKTGNVSSIEVGRQNRYPFSYRHVLLTGVVGAPFYAPLALVFVMPWFAVSAIIGIPALILSFLGGYLLLKNGTQIGLNIVMNSGITYFFPSTDVEGLHMVALRASRIISQMDQEDASYTTHITDNRVSYTNTKVNGVMNTGTVSGDMRDIILRESESKRAEL